MNSIKEKISKLTLIDWLIIFVILGGLIAYIYKPSSELSYRGNQMFNAIKTHQKLDTNGFLVEAGIKGTLLLDKSDFDETGILLQSTGGRFRFRLKDGRILTIGGELAYVEDVAANEIEMKPLDNFLITFYAPPQEFNSYSELLNFLNAQKSSLKAEHLYMDSEIAVDKPLSEAEKQVLRNKLIEMYRIRDVYMPTRESSKGVSISFIRADSEELQKLKEILDGGKVATSSFKLFLGYSSEPNEQLEALKKQGKDAHIVSTKT